MRPDMPASWQPPCVAGTRRRRLLPATRLVIALTLGTLIVAGCAGNQMTLPGASSGSDAALNVAPGSNEEFEVSVGNRIYFNENSAELTDIARETLDKQVGWLAKYPRDRIQIEGHADEKGSAAVNQTLGQRRADAVKTYLAARGLGSANITTTTFGNQQPVRKCNDISCWSQNRRAVTVIQG
jgi:peptidoglycan-associated lipoprotein